MWWYEHSFFLQLPLHLCGKKEGHWLGFKINAPSPMLSIHEKNSSQWWHRYKLQYKIWYWIQIQNNILNTMCTMTIKLLYRLKYGTQYKIQIWNTIFILIWNTNMKYHTNTEYGNIPYYYHIGFSKLWIVGKLDHIF